MIVYYVWPIFMILLVIGIVNFSTKKRGAAKEEFEKFLKDNPDAVMIYSTKSNFITFSIKGLLDIQTIIYIRSVNKETPHTFINSLGASQGIYVKPGENILNVGAYRKRSKGRTRIICDDFDLVVNIEANKQYKLICINNEIVCEEIHE